MRAVIQRVSSARVVINGLEHSRIAAGILVLLGVEKEDADNDADSDGADFLTWQQQLGSTTATAAQTAIPEPASAVLLALAALTAGRACVIGRRGRGVCRQVW